MISADVAKSDEKVINFHFTKLLDILRSARFRNPAWRGGVSSIKSGRKDNKLLKLPKRLFKFLINFFLLI